MNLNFLSSLIINAAITVHKALGPGLLESVYQQCMVIEIRDRDINVQKEVPLPVSYRGIKIHDEGFKIDLLIEDLIIVELKSVEKVKPVHKKQLYKAKIYVFFSKLCLTSHLINAIVSISWKM